METLIRLRLRLRLRLSENFIPNVIARNEAIPQYEAEINEVEAEVKIKRFASSCCYPKQ
jgi:hypothetical protein